MINRPSTTTSVFRHWGFGLRSSFVVRRSSFPVARHDCTEEQLGQRFCGTCPRIFRGKRAIIEGKEFRVPPTDRKSTRLNSSHSQISYAVFCLKKKKTTNNPYTYHV